MWVSTEISGFWCIGGRVLMDLGLLNKEHIPTPKHLKSLLPPSPQRFLLFLIEILGCPLGGCELLVSRSVPMSARSFYNHFAHCMSLSKSAKNSESP